MTAEEMWQTFSRESGIRADYEAWSFGDDADRLASLVLRGIKTATCSALPLYEPDGESLPRAGEYSVILDSRDQAVCIIQTTKVYQTPFRQITADHAWKEGEGDRSLACWQKVHEAFLPWSCRKPDWPLTGISCWFVRNSGDFTLDKMGRIC